MNPSRPDPLPYLLLLVLSGCARPDPSLRAGLPTDLANTPQPVPSSPAPVLAYDGYYRGVVAASSPLPPTCATPGPIPRDMLVANGRATFGVNLPFSAPVPANGQLAMRYLKLATLQGEFADDRFAGSMQADADPACRWTVRLDRIAEPPAFAAVQPQPVDLQPPDPVPVSGLPRGSPAY